MATWAGRAERKRSVRSERRYGNTSDQQILQPFRRNKACHHSLHSLEWLLLKHFALCPGTTVCRGE